MAETSRDADPFQATSLAEAFALRAAQQPADIAVAWNGGAWSYAELLAASHAMATTLASSGVEQGDVVAVHGERRVETIAAILGILELGAAYLPLEPSLPIRRARQMLADAAAKLLVGDENVAAAIAGGIRRVPPLFESPPTERCYAQAAPAASDLAYVIYTSGSTGEPKGVMNTHAGIMNRLRWMQAEYRLGAFDRVLQKTTLAFDVSVWEVFWPLLAGGRLVLLADGRQSDVECIVDTIDQHGVTIIHFVPSMLDAMLPTLAGQTDRLSSLRLVISSGEALHWRSVERFLEFASCRFDNLYGPTEAAIDVSQFACTPRQFDPTESVVPIGKPIDGMHLYVLERSDALPVRVARGAVGELAIAGVGLARGYWRRPALTAERFVPDPFGRTPGARIYKTGDLAREDSDGHFHYLGRVDLQLKIRGHRVELLEIEAVIAEHEGVRSAAVLPLERASGTTLLGFIVVDPRGFQGTDVLVRALQQQLPTYMMPEQITCLDELPTTPSGKVDRAELSKIARAAMQVLAQERDTTATAEDMLELVTAIVSELVIDPRKVKPESVFFEIGLDSLRMIQLHQRLEQETGQRFSLLDFLAYPSIARLAEHIVGMRRPDGDPQRSVEMRREGRARIARSGMRRTDRRL